MWGRNRNKSDSTSEEKTGGESLKSYDKNSSSIIIHKKTYLPVTLLFIAIVIALGVVMAMKYFPDTTQPTAQRIMPCAYRVKSNIVYRASIAQNPKTPEKLKELIPIAEEVLTYKNYENDSYCLHILATRYIYVSDYENSKKYLDLLDKQLKEDGVPDIGMVPYFRTIKDMRENVDFLSKLEEQSKNNNIGIIRKKPDGTLLDEK